jgi:hypothetical protein
MKKCKQCGETKPLTDFSKRPDKPDGFHWHCKGCNNAWQSQRRRIRKPHIAEREALFACAAGMKRCTQCLEVKAVDKFSKKEDGRNNLHAHCGECDTKKKQAYHKRTYHLRKTEANKATRARWRDQARLTPRHALILAIRSGLRRRPTNNPVTIDQLMQIFKDQDGRCALSGIRMEWSAGKSNGMPQPRSMALDRIDSDGGYEFGNVRLLCFCVNNFRGKMSDDETREMLRLFFEHQFEQGPSFMPTWAAGLREPMYQ